MVLVFIVSSNAKQYIYGGIGGGISRYRDSNSIPKCIGVNCGLGYYIFEKIVLTFDFDYNHYFPIVAKDGIREYHVNYKDLFISGNVLILENTYIQVGVGPSFVNSHIEFLRDTVIFRWWEPYDSVFYQKGDIYGFSGSFLPSCKASVLYEISGFENHLQLYGKIKASSGKMFVNPAEGAPYSDAHLPFHLSLGIIVRFIATDEEEHINTRP